MFEERGEFPQLVIICLPNDHTSGTRRGAPAPAACVADNDLALGRIVEALSHSRFWRQMVIFAIEDDPQDGFDHVSGYRTTAYLAGPYVKRGVRISTRYNTISILRTMEQILGLPPMNQFDASADPMFDCFTDTPGLHPDYRRAQPGAPGRNEPRPAGNSGSRAPAGGRTFPNAEPQTGGRLPGGRPQPDPLTRHEGQCQAVSRMGGHNRRGRRLTGACVPSKPHSGPAPCRS
jgi:hypothetical protein